jgi:hypothetical protein
MTSQNSDLSSWDTLYGPGCYFAQQRAFYVPNCMNMQRNFSEDGGGMFRFYMQLEDCTTSQLT